MPAWNDHSLLCAYQTAHGTPNTTPADFVALQCDRPEVKFEHEIVELDLLTGQVGAAPERLIGRRSGSLRFTYPLEGFADGYNPTVEDPGGAPEGAGDEVIPPWFVLICNAMGSNMSAVASNANFWRGLGASVSQYIVDGQASGDETKVVFDDAPASVDVGQLVVVALTPTSTTLQIGFAKTKDTVTKTITLFEDAKKDVTGTSADIFGTATGYVSSEITNTAPLTFRWTGPETKQCYVLEDAYCDGFKINWESGAVPTCEFSYKFYNFQRNELDGGLVVPDGYNRIPQLIGSHNATATIDGDNTCGLESCTWEWKPGTIRETKCHGSNNGIDAVEIISPRVTASFSIPDDSDDAVLDSAGGAATLGQHLWTSKLELGTTLSIGVYVGSVVGKVFAMLIPSGTIVATPDVGFRDTTVIYTLTVEATSYTGDVTDTTETSANSPLDSLARVALA